MCGGALDPEQEEIQPEQRLQTRRHSTQHLERLPWHSRAENCQRSDIPKHPGEAGRPETVKRIEQECRRQLGALLPLVKRLRVAKKLLPLALEDAFYS